MYRKVNVNKVCRMTGLREHDNNSNADSVSGDEKGGGGGGEGSTHATIAETRLKWTSLKTVLRCN